MNREKSEAVVIYQCVTSGDLYELCEALSFGQDNGSHIRETCKPV